MSAMKAKFSFLFFILFVICKYSFSQIAITFTVDMTGQYITPQGMHIAGQFADDNSISIDTNWGPGAGGSQLALISGSTYSVTVLFPSSSAGEQLEFEFVRSNEWGNGITDFSEGNPGDTSAHIDNSCGVPDGTGGYNRIITIPPCGGVFTSVFNYCGTLVASTSADVNAGPDQYIMIGGSAQLSATGLSNYSWQPSAGLSCTNCSSPIASPAATTSYIVTGTSTGGCSGSDTVTVFVGKSPCLPISFSNAFTPNGDGINDLFGPISSTNQPVQAFMIYNRWGELVFESKNISHKWDGNFNGLPQPAGTYVYCLLVDCNGKIQTIKGTVELLR
jgi:gliding motility-associated-like protein